MSSGAGRGHGEGSRCSRKLHVERMLCECSIVKSDGIFDCRPKTENERKGFTSPDDQRKE